MYTPRNYLHYIKVSFCLELWKIFVHYNFFKCKLSEIFLCVVGTTHMTLLLKYLYHYFVCVRRRNPPPGTGFLLIMALWCAIFREQQHTATAFMVTRRTAMPLASQQNWHHFVSKIAANRHGCHLYSSLLRNQGTCHHRRHCQGSRHSTFSQSSSLRQNHDRRTSHSRMMMTNNNNDHRQKQHQSHYYGTSNDKRSTVAVWQKDLNPSQMEAVTKPLNCVTRVVAGPGSGKTR